MVNREGCKRKNQINHWAAPGYWPTVEEKRLQRGSEWTLSQSGYWCHGGIATATLVGLSCGTAAEPVASISPQPPPRQ